MNSERRTIRFTLNGRAVAASIAVHETIIQVLQRDFNLYGARESCEQGLCGCCTIMVNGKAVSGCLYLAAFADGKELLTVEGLAVDGVQDTIQRAFVCQSGFQCGFCTPGFILMTRELLARNPKPSDDEIRHYLSGNLCRCCTYPDIIASVKAAAGGETPLTSK